MIYRLIGKEKSAFEIDLSREELQKILETHEEEGDEFNLVVSNIFAFRKSTVLEVMTKLTHIELMPATTTIGQLRQKIAHSTQAYFPLYHKSPGNIVGIAFPRDLVDKPDHQEVRAFAKSPWFIPVSSQLTQLLQQFRRNKQRVSIVLSSSGIAIGVLTLSTLLERMLGEIRVTEKCVYSPSAHPVIQRTFPGNKKIREFNQEYGAQLPTHGVETLAQLLITHLDDPATSGDSVIVDHFELLAEETSLLGIKSITIKTLES
jgi:CBS domain containing-hemolysin-like protein